jgi:very-short-patch-repair endonuclease
MFRYARRRGIEKAIRDFIHEETRIVLEDDK